MTDYKEEQNNEIEALESIYPEEIEVLSTTPHHCFQIRLTSQNSQDDPENAASCTVKFTYTPSYPDELPVIEITESENLAETQLEEIVSTMKEQGEENLGMVMVFSMVSAVQEQLEDMVVQMKEAKENEKERLKREEEEAERKRLEGTRVTIESFLAWKSSFDAEVAETKMKNAKKEATNAKKLTGKELFMQDHSLDDSDVKFLEEDGDAVEVDESLFEDMDDLDLEDES